MADMEGDLSNALSASLSSLMSGVDKALSALGRFNVTLINVSEEFIRTGKVEQSTLSYARSWF